jgi:hypothetical protein
MDKENIEYICQGILLRHKEKYEIMLCAGKWMELEVITQSKISQAQKAKYCIFLFICGT